mmetsp:Transcript_16951/g.17014  ORF Transcript_16951/g.17014 Transcript_16951/m.17014 type:complete len:385 (+) Transcript_16951:129-1283(+)|eukprot:CAMPEP_0182427884 /NCGR_PEP_ID=MMETSP1167-20130531/20556_1 /TAXON_ID=2988 /ORGANISM="Mallomonas Sp, Strain CCMP3275" /LENGTH=384 /DNA_ID=CAMNT_0024610453 /DNA_START=125 /DNA_END=1279 /DNA_ORIENTATION=+
MGQKQSGTTGSNGSGRGALSTRKFHRTYMLARELGTGAFSVVKLAINKTSGESVAVKIVDKKKLSEEDLESLAMEIQILDILDHPHIIKLLEVFEENGEFFIVTELVQGGELFDRIVSKSHYTEKEARDLIKIFLETMKYMHAEGVVHRDLKPENLLLTSDENDSDVKIADFGFAKKIADLLPNEVACGTPGYVAPEILRGDAYGPEVDIWSMGVICYVLLAGYPPFYDEDQKKLFKKIKEGRYYFHEDYWSNVSEDAMDLIRKMLCVNQRERWTASQLLDHPWMSAGDDRLAAKSLTGAIVEMKRFNARRRFKSATDAVMIANRMKKLMSAMGSAAQTINETNEEAEEDTGYRGGMPEDATAEKKPADRPSKRQSAAASSGGK